MNTSSKVLITGVAGLIGSHMAEYLVRKGYRVYGLDNLSGGYRQNIPPKTMFYEGDLNDTEWLGDIFEIIKPDYVYHFAAYAAEGLSPFIRNFNYTNNLVGSVNVINECIKHEVKKIIFTSSMAVYGENKVPFTESMQPSPADPYGIAKYAVELDLAQAHDQFGLQYSVVRPHNVIGIHQNIWDKYRNVVGIWIRRSLNKESIQIFGDGEQKRAFSDIKYCLPIFEKLMTAGHTGTFNIGSDTEYTLNQVADIVGTVANEFGYTPTIEYLEQRHEVKNAYCSHKKAKKELGFEDKTDINQTIYDMFSWASLQPYREIKEMDYELTKGMYNYWK